MQTPEGIWAIDHKSDRIQDPIEAFTGYLPQIKDHASALEAEGTRVPGVGIDWIWRGEVTVAGASGFVSVQGTTPAELHAER